MVTVMMTMLLGFAALTIDLGMLYNVRGDLQRSADSTALSSAMTLLNQDRLKGTAELYGVIANSRTAAFNYAAKNAIYGVPTPTLNNSDVVVGYLRDPTSTSEIMDLSDPSRYNAVRVRVRRDSVTNGPVQLLFGRVFGLNESEVFADATAAFMDGINGFRVTPETGNAGLLPLALKVTSWQNLFDGTVHAGDNWTYNAETDTVTPGPDGILELNLYPGSGGTQLPPGNFGTVDIGSPNNSTADLARQIRYGVSADDLAYFGGEFKLGPDGTILLNGDTGLSAGIKDDLAAIIGQPRTIPLFSTVSGPGNNAWFTVVGFAGIRIMDVKLTGSMSSKKVIIQPAMVVDDSALAGPANESSYFVYQPVRLVR
jgi:hypothetical protein